MLDRDCRSYQVFQGAISRPLTLQQYTYSLNAFCEFSKIKSFDDLAKLDTDEIQNLLENWVLSMSKVGKKGTYIKARVSGVELFLEMNKKVIYKKILHKLIPKDTKLAGGDQPYVTEEIDRMLKSTKKLRTKALIHFLASTGIRPGALVDPVIRKSHLVEMPHDCMAVMVYDESKEGYWAFLTPEAKKALNDYLNSRRINGETITDQSPLFASDTGKKNDFMTYASIYQTITGVLKGGGIVRVKVGSRHDKATNYGFRKRFNGILKMNNQVNSNIAEKLMAHKKGLDGVYLKPTREECFAEFFKAVRELTIDETNRTKALLKQKEIEFNELEQKQSKINEQEDRIQNLENFVIKIQDVLRLPEYQETAKRIEEQLTNNL